MNKSGCCPNSQNVMIRNQALSAYMPPYRMKGFLPYPEPPKPPTVPEDLRKSIELERRESLGQKEEPPLPLQFNKSFAKDALKAVLQQHYCMIFNSKGVEGKCNGRKCKKPLSDPPSGISKCFWKLQQEHFARSPSRSKFRTTRFLFHEKQDLKPRAAFPLYESPSCYEIPKWKFTPKKVPFKLSEPQKRAELVRWYASITDNLNDLQRSQEEWARQTDHSGFVPKDRVNFGCERIRELAAINANIVYLLVRKFVTGPPHKDLHWLNRTEAVECWERIVGKDKVVKDCCVEEPLIPQPKPEIAALKTPKKKKVGGQDKSKPKVLKLSKSTGARQSKVKAFPKIPPFCKPIPPPELRLPWHIPPLKPRDGNDRRKKIVFDRNIDLDFIIKPYSDPYGEDRKKQKDARIKALRQAMTNDFFKRTDMDSHLTEMDMILNHAQQNFDGTAKSRRDLMLAQILAKDEVGNTAEKQRESEAETERLERLATRNRLPDFSHVASRYKEVGKYKSRGVAGLI